MTAITNIITVQHFGDIIEAILFANVCGQLWLFQSVCLYLICEYKRRSVFRLKLHHLKCVQSPIICFADVYTTLENCKCSQKNN